MRKILLNVAISLDGFIEGPKREIDWCFTDQDYGMAAFMKRIDAIFFGRKSYELLLKMDPHPYPSLKKYVFSRTLARPDAGTDIIRGDVEREVQRVKRQTGKDIWLFGGASLLKSFLNHDLVDELHLAVHPLLLGGGTPLFYGVQRRSVFTLKTTKEYSTGLVQLVYLRKRR